ncbi:FG-GAP-like repeat-containing protein [Kutzneria albida]|uniref:SGNH hydrolase-type esterase domain-containing protein n=1 Tax=Kutzneria albida DSM 43870 TaxID=1449976 RepID=W5WEQ4_9PSEU|nr:FG-GAP-like repeat-containing protein [Kutzneria albida]AHH99332.1 hypothetical protein KALB_5972 [Kutzneria albida DSM 43870]
MRTAAALVLTALLAGSPSAPAPLPVVRVMPLGDSITFGVGSSTGAGYRLPLSQAQAGQSNYRLDLVGSVRAGQLSDPDNEGHSGWMINDIAGQVDVWLATYRPDVVLLHIGINDLDRGADKPHAADRLAALVARIYADRPGVTLVLSGLIGVTPGLESLVADYNNRARALVAQYRASGGKIVYEDLPLTSAQLNDRLHPNDSGYATMARAFDAGLRQGYANGWFQGRVPAPGAPETRSKVRWADLDGDGHADYLVLNDNGSVDAWINKGGDGHGGWIPWGQVASGLTTDRGRVRLADFDGDGRADYLLLNDNGSVHVWLNKGGDGHGGWVDGGQVATGTTTNREQVRFADLDGDGHADYLVLNDNGSVHAWLNRGGDGHGGWVDDGQVAGGLTTDRDRVRLADLDGDRRADYLLVNQDGSTRVFYNRGGDGHGGWVDGGQANPGATTVPDQVRYADVTGDGHADYLVVNQDGSVHAWVNQSDFGQIATGVVTE